MFSQGFQAAVEICVSSQNLAGGYAYPLQVHSTDPKQGRLFQQADILQPLDNNIDVYEIIVFNCYNNMTVRY